MYPCDRTPEDFVTLEECRRRRLRRHGFLDNLEEYSGVDATLVNI